MPTPQKNANVDTVRLSDEDLKNAEEIISRFGGIRPMAAAIEAPVTTVQGWKKRGVIPNTRRDDIELAALRKNINLEGLSSSTTSLKDITDSKPVTVVPPVTKTTAQSDKESKKDKGADEERKPISFATVLSNENVAAPNKELKAEKQKAEEKSAKSGPEKDGTNGRGGHGALWLLNIILIALFVAAAAFFWPFYNAQEAEQQRVATLEAQINTLESELVSVKESMSQQGESAEASEEVSVIIREANEMRDELKTLAARTKALTEQVENTDTGVVVGRLNRIEEQLGTLTSSPELSNLMARFEDVRQNIQNNESVDSAVEELNQIVASLQTRMDTLDQALGTTGTRTTELAAQASNLNADDVKATAMLLALSQLRDSLNRNEAPFESDLALLYNLIGDDHPELRQSLEKLAPYAEQGVMSPSALSDELRSLTGEITIAALSGEDISLVDRAKARLGSFVKIERDGEALTGTQTETKMARAQSLLDTGDVQGAVKVLEGLDGNAARMAAPFLQKAKLTLDAQSTERMIRGFITQQARMIRPLDSAANPRPQDVLPTVPGRTEPLSRPNFRDFSIDQ